MRIGWKKLVGIGGVTLYGYDYHFRYQRIHRSFRTLFVAASTLFEYKVLYSLFPEKLEEIHERVAIRLATTCGVNGGVYVKFGQAVASMNHILPLQFRNVFTALQDRAPPSPYSEVEELFREEFGRKAEEVFLEFDPIPIASASIAQVHKAKLPDGTPVAVKIQKPPIQCQLVWDLLLYQGIMWAFEKAFDLPVYWTVEFTKSTLMKEVDFKNEAKNMSNAKEVFSDPNIAPRDLRESIYVPTLYKDFSTSRVLVGEWIDGCKITDQEGMKERGIEMERAVTMMVKAFGFQIFQTGMVHCDPHPGNVLVRLSPSKTPQVVLLDHGMYIHESEAFRKQYCELWQAMFLLDQKRLLSICREWGIKDAEFFASMQLMRPYSANRLVHNNQPLPKAELQRLQKQAKERFKMLLKQSKGLPNELIFVGRCMNLVRATNKELGSPVNRIDILASCAATGGSCEGPKKWPVSLFDIFLIADYLCYRRITLQFHILSTGGSGDQIPSQILETKSQLKKILGSKQLPKKSKDKLFACFNHS